MPVDYELVNIRPDELVTTELTRELGDLRSGESIEAYRVKLNGEPGAQSGGNAAELLFLPEEGRAGIGWGGEAVWTDASSADEALERYLDHNILEPDTLGSQLLLQDRLGREKRLHEK